MRRNSHRSPHPIYSFRMRRKTAVFICFNPPLIRDRFSLNLEAF